MLSFNGQPKNAETSIAELTADVATLRGIRYKYQDSAAIVDQLSVVINILVFRINEIEKTLPQQASIEPSELPESKLPESKVKTVERTLVERGKRYGDFREHVHITQGIKRIMQVSPNWTSISEAQKESLEMIAHKIGRILNGDPDYIDSWHDIAGYAQLVENILLPLTGD